MRYANLGISIFRGMKPFTALRADALSLPAAPPHGAIDGYERGYLSVLGYLHPNTLGRISGWTPNAHSADVCFASCGYAAEFCTGRGLTTRLQCAENPVSGS